MTATRSPIPYRIHGPQSVQDLAEQLNMILAQLGQRVDTLEGSAGTYNALAAAVKGIVYGANTMTWGATAPDSLAWEQGDVCWNTGATSGGAPGWVCTAPGTPGTWKAMANLA